MSCNINYLKNKASKANYSTEQLAALTTFHYQIKDSLLSTGYLRSYKGSIYLFKDKLVSEAIGALGETNKLYRDSLKGQKIVTLNSITKEVTIDISPLIDTILAGKDAEDKYIEEKTFQDQNQLEEIFYLTTPSQPLDQSAIDAKLNKATVLFKDIIQRLRKEVTETKAAVGQKFYFQKYNKLLNEVETSLKNPEELLAVNNFIHLSVGKLNDAKASFKIVKEELAELIKKYGRGNIPKKELEAVSYRMNEIKDTIQFYSNVERIKATLLTENQDLTDLTGLRIGQLLDQKVSNERLDKENKTYFQAYPALRIAYDNLDFSKKQTVIDFYNQFLTAQNGINRLDTDTMTKITQLLESVGLDLTSINIVDDMFGIEQELNYSNLNSQMANALYSSLEITSQLQDFLSTVVAEWIYPYINDVNETLDDKLRVYMFNKINEFNRQWKDDSLKELLKDFTLQSLEDKVLPYIKNKYGEESKIIEKFYKIHKEDTSLLDKKMSVDDIKDSLIKADKDLSWFETHLSASVSVSDPVIAAVALSIKQAIYKANNESNDSLVDLENAFYDYFESVQGNKVNSLLSNTQMTDIDELHKPFLRKAVVQKKGANGLPELDENGQIIYTEHDAFHEEYFEDLWKKAFNEFEEKLAVDVENIRIVAEYENLKYKLENPQDPNPFKTQESIEENIKKYQTKERIAWHSIHTSSKFKDSVNSKKLEDFINEHLEKYNEAKFADWLSANTYQVTDSIYYQNDGSAISTEDFLREEGKLLPKEYYKYLSVQPGKIVALSGDFNRPSDLYVNPEFSKLNQIPYFKELYRQYKQGNNNIDIKYRRLPFGIIPQIVKDEKFNEKTERIFTKTKGLKDVKSIPGKASRWFSRAIDEKLTAEDNLQPYSYEDEDGNIQTIMVSKTKQKPDGTVVRNIPIRYTVRIDTNDVSKNLFQTVAMFSSAQQHYKSLSELEPNIELLQSLINSNESLKLKAREVVATDNKGDSVVSFVQDAIPNFLTKSGEVRLNTLLNEFVNDVFYGEEEEAASLNLLGYNLSLNKLGRGLSGITSYYSMAFNVTAGLNNIVIGNMTVQQEAIAGKYMTVDSLQQGRKLYRENLMMFMKDIVETRLGKKSLITQLFLRHDAVQGEFLDAKGKTITQPLINRYFTLNSLFFIQNAGEHQIQGSSFLGLLMNTKFQVPLLDNNRNLVYENGQQVFTEISLFNAYEQDQNGKLIIKPEYQEYITDKDEELFRNKLHALNKLHHGNYNSFDKSSLQRKFYGKLALMFRKYLYTAFKARYGKEQIDFELGDVTVGYYSETGKIARDFYRKLTSELKEYKAWAFMSYYKNELTSDQQYAVKKTTTEIAYLLAASLLGTLLGSLELEDGEPVDSLNDFMRLEVERIRTDLIQFTVPLGINALLRLFTSPSAVLNVLEKFIKLFDSLVNDVSSIVTGGDVARYKRDTGAFDKGTSKTWAMLVKNTPVLRQIINLMTPDEQIKYYGLLNSGSVK